VKCFCKKLKLNLGSHSVSLESIYLENGFWKTLLEDMDSGLHGCFDASVLFFLADNRLAYGS
jgi:hypothetical protein